MCNRDCTNSNRITVWMDNWSAFVRTLRTQFGPIDPTANAEDAINNLKMQDNQKMSSTISSSISSRYAPIGTTKSFVTTTTLVSPKGSRISWVIMASQTHSKK